MASNRNFIYFLRNFLKKHRLSLRDQRDDNEVWYMYISPLELLGLLVAVILVIFIILLTVVAYTPVLEMVPGYKGYNSREALIGNIIKVDSLRHRLDELQAYSDDVALIMDGKTPVLRNVEQQGDSMQVSKPEAVARNAADSALRRQMEGTGIYGLGTTEATGKGTRGEAFVTPVRGVVADHFSPKDSRYGLSIATASSQQVLAVGDGTIVLSMWSPDEGNVVEIQHSGNTISYYKHIVQPLRAVGSRVKAGDVIGYTGEGLSGEEGKGFFQFELWVDGVPVDPEGYMNF
jgi:murein DD-endopeptidase MepM/ murein hydrolase activator NlpD